MSSTLWLITEGETDYRVVKALIEKRQFPIRVEWLKPSGKTPGLSRMVAELRLLIRQGKAQMHKNDCVVVLHDYDVNQAERDPYDRIAEICRKEGQVSLIVAQDAIDAWLLSDSGVCQWLGIALSSHNETPNPKERLKTTMNAQHGLKYPRHLEKLLTHLTADSQNVSFQQALTQLQNARCVQTDRS